MVRTIADAIGGTVRQRDRPRTPGSHPDRKAARQGRDWISTRSREEFGISRTPVREALLELSFQGLVDIAPRSGVTVIGVTPAEALDNFAILATLSGKAAEWAAIRISPEALADLARQAQALAAAPIGPGLIDANWQFHRIINEAAGSKHLLSLIRQAVRLIPSNFLAVMPVRTHDGEHEQLLHRITDGDAPAARAVAEQHVLAAGASVAGWLAEQAAMAGDTAAGGAGGAASSSGDGPGELLRQHAAAAAALT